MSLFDVDRRIALVGLDRDAVMVSWNDFGYLESIAGDPWFIDPTPYGTYGRAVKIAGE